MSVDRVEVRSGTYHDSVVLLSASRGAETVDGVEMVIAAQATPLNLELLAERGFIVDGGARPDDLVLAVRAEGDEALDSAAAALDERLGDQRIDVAETRPGRSDRSLPELRVKDPTHELAIVSVPGRYAAYECARAIEAGMHVFCFSNGIGLAQESALKDWAVERGLLFMGPDCGTAILDGVALGFANDLKRGPVGIVGASGTGMQEVSCLLDAAGIGISHAIGVGGRDLDERVGGTMTMHALDLLDRDPDTELVIVVSKPPSPGVGKRILDRAADLRKPAVTAFLGTSSTSARSDRVTIAASLQDAATHAIRTVLGTDPEPLPLHVARVDAPYIRGLFCGGSLCYEVQTIVSRHVGRVSSNVPLEPGWRLQDEDRSEGHTFVDFGSDRFTDGRLHPMLDSRLRDERFTRETEDAQVGVVILDVLLGYGSNAEPVAGLGPRIEAARRSRSDGLAVVVSLCGTDRDPQGLMSQQAALEDAGAIVTRSSGQAALLSLAAIGALP